MDDNTQGLPSTGDKTVLYGLLTRPQGTETWYWVKYKKWEIGDKDYWDEKPQNPTGWGIIKPDMEQRKQQGHFYFITKQPFTGKFIKKHGYNFIYNPYDRFNNILKSAIKGSPVIHIYFPHGTPFVKRTHYREYIFERPYESKVITDARIHKQLKISQERVDFVKKLYLFWIQFNNSVFKSGTHTGFIWRADGIINSVPTFLDNEYKKVFNTKYSLVRWEGRYMQVIRYMQQLGYITLTNTSIGFQIDLSTGLSKISTTPEGIDAVASMF